MKNEETSKNCSFFLHQIRNVEVNLHGINQNIQNTTNQNEQNFSEQTVVPAKEKLPKFG